MSLRSILVYSSTLVSCFIPAVSLAETLVNQQEMQNIQVDLECLKQVGAGFDLYNSAMKTALKKQPNSIHTAFELFRQKHFRFLTSLESHLKSVNSASEEGQLREALSNFFNRMKLIELDYENANTIATNFLREFDQLGQSLQISNNGAQDILSKRLNCSDETLAHASKLQDQTNKWLLKLSQMREFVDKSFQFRRLILVRASTDLRAKLEKRYADKVGSSVAELRNELEGALAGADLQIEIEEWGARATGPESQASKEKGRFLQFDSALLAYQKAKQEELEYSKRLNALNMPSGQKEVVNSRLRFFRTGIDNALKELSELGWQGQVEKQKAMVASLQSFESQLPPDCVTLVRSHRSFAENAQTTEQLSALSGLFRKMVLRCNL